MKVLMDSPRTPVSRQYAGCARLGCRDGALRGEIGRMARVVVCNNVAVIVTPLPIALAHRRLWARKAGRGHRQEAGKRRSGGRYGSRH